MAVLTLPDLMARRSADLITRLICKSIVTTDALAARIPFKTFNSGPSIIYQRERSLGTAAFIPDAGTVAAADNGSDDLITVPVRAISSSLDVTTLVDVINGGEMGNQILKRVKQTWRLVSQTMVTGGNTTGFALSDNFQSGAYVDAITAYSSWLDSNRYGPGSLKYTHTGTFLQFRAPGDSQYGEQVACATDGSYTVYSANKSKWITVTLDVSDATANAVREITFTTTNDAFDGINRMMAPSMLIASSGNDGDAYGLATLDALMDTEKVNSNRAFIMNGKLIRKHLGALRALGGADPVHMSIPGYAGQVLTYRGVPILQNDNIPNTESKGSATTLSSVYLASLDTSDGLYMGTVGTGNDAVDVDGDPRRSPVAGFLLESLGSLEGSAVRRARVSWFGAAALGSDKALARASEIITT